MKKRKQFLTLSILAFSFASVMGSPAVNLTGSDTGSSDGFGSSISASGDYAIFGSSTEEASGKSSSFNSGSAYVFFKNAGTWGEQVKLTASDADSADAFGYSVGIDGDYVIVGSYLAEPDTNAQGDTLSAKFNSGQVYFFERSGTNWSEIAKIAGTDSLDYFGHSVDISGDYAIIGAYADNDTSKGISNSGAVYIVKRTGVLGWVNPIKINSTSSINNGGFGYSVAIDGDYAVVGATADSVHVLKRDGEDWNVQAKFYSNDSWFGEDVAIHGNRILVSAYNKVFVYQRIGDTWSLEIELTPDLGFGSGFGYKVSIADSSVIVGSAYNSGYVHLFEKIGSNWNAIAVLTSSSSYSNIGDSRKDVFLTSNDAFYRLGTNYITAIPVPFDCGFDDGDITETISSNGSVSFADSDEETAVDLVFSGVSNSANVRVKSYFDSYPTNVQADLHSLPHYRWYITDTGLSFTNAEIRIDKNLIPFPIVSADGKQTIYQRATEGSGDFVALTTMEVGNELVANVSSFGEFVIRTSVFDSADVAINISSDGTNDFNITGEETAVSLDFSGVSNSADVGVIAYKVSANNNPWPTFGYKWVIADSGLNFTNAEIRFDLDKFPNTSTANSLMTIFSRSTVGSGEFIGHTTIIDGNELVANVSSFGEFVIRTSYFQNANVTQNISANGEVSFNSIGEETAFDIDFNNVSNSGDISVNSLETSNSSILGKFANAIWSVSNSGVNFGTATVKIDVSQMTLDFSSFNLNDFSIYYHSDENYTKLSTSRNGNILSATVSDLNGVSFYLGIDDSEADVTGNINFGSYSFTEYHSNYKEETSVYLSFKNLTSSGAVRVQGFNSSFSLGSITGTNGTVLPAHWIITNLGASFDSADVNFAHHEIPNIGDYDANDLIVYSRPTSGSGTYSPIATESNLSIAKVNVKSFSEFVLVESNFDSSEVSQTALDSDISFNDINNETAVDIEFENVTSSASVTVKSFKDAESIDGVTPIAARWEITGSPTFGATSKIKIDYRLIPNWTFEPNEVIIYTRATIGSGNYIPLTTTLNGNFLEANISGLGEFTLAETNVDPTITSKVVDSDGSYTFGGSGTSFNIEFNGVTNSNVVQVKRYDENSLEDSPGIIGTVVPAEWTVTNNGVNFDSAKVKINYTEIENSGITDSSKVIIYKRESSGEDYTGTLTTVNGDWLETWVTSFSDFALGILPDSTTEVQTVSGDDTTSFEDASMDLVFSGVSNSADIQVGSYSNAPTGTNGITGTPLAFRWVITNNGLTFGTAEIRINYTQIPGVTDPSQLVIYRRPDAGTGDFVALPTTVDGDFIVATTTQFSEFAIGNDDVPLFVELSFFDAQGQEDKILLTWSTESEIENEGFEILRSTSEEGKFTKIASYKTHEELEGAGTSSNLNSYAFADKNVETGIEYWYKLVDVDFYGRKTEHQTISAKLSNEGNVTISRFALHQNFPNPFNPSTTIRFDVPNLQDGLKQVKIIVYNLKGQKVKTLFSGAIEGGRHSVVWNGLNSENKTLASGIYFVRLETPTLRLVKKVTLLK